MPEVSRGPLRDLPAEGRPMSALTETGNHARQTSGTQGKKYSFVIQVSIFIATQYNPVTSDSVFTAGAFEEFKTWG